GDRARHPRRRQSRYGLQADHGHLRQGRRLRAFHLYRPLGLSDARGGRQRHPADGQGSPAAPSSGDPHPGYGRPGTGGRAIEARLQRNAPAYEQDFVAWLEDQAQHARRHDIENLDLENIAEELEGMARSDRREIRNHLIVLLVHLLMHKFQPRRRSRGWRATIAEQRQRIAAVIDDSPSLQPFPASIINRCYADARSQAALETSLSAGDFPETCPLDRKSTRLNSSH